MALASRKVTLKPTVEAVRKWLIDVVDNPQARRQVLQFATEELKQRAEVYPAPGLWNFEPGAQGNGIWYERGWGSRWRLRDGRLSGRKTSQKLDRSWRKEIGESNYHASVYTEVTYAPYLLDPEQRVSWAEAHGWQTIDDISDSYAPRFEELVLEAIDVGIGKPIKS